MVVGAVSDIDNLLLSRHTNSCCQGWVRSAPRVSMPAGFESGIRYEIKLLFRCILNQLLCNLFIRYVNIICSQLLYNYFVFVFSVFLCFVFVFCLLFFFHSLSFDFKAVAFNNCLSRLIESLQIESINKSLLYNSHDFCLYDLFCNCNLRLTTTTT